MRTRQSGSQANAEPTRAPALRADRETERLRGPEDSLKSASAAARSYGLYVPADAVRLCMRAGTRSAAPLACGSGKGCTLARKGDAVTPAAGGARGEGPALLGPRALPGGDLVLMGARDVSLERSKE